MVPLPVGEVRHSPRTRHGTPRRPSRLRPRPDLSHEEAAAGIPDNVE
ncbi:hypothetical protein [Streptomyces incanus]|uniref:Uncharacterized protein n=1 Tax=Streptomyces incanus TaxID=887453 RepID=A0ABW0XRV6_9ACTN